MSTIHLHQHNHITTTRNNVSKNIARKSTCQLLGWPHWSSNPRFEQSTSENPTDLPRHTALNPLQAQQLLSRRLTLHHPQSTHSHLAFKPRTINEIMAVHSILFSLLRKMKCSLVQNLRIYRWNNKSGFIIQSACDLTANNSLSGG